MRTDYLENLGLDPEVHGTILDIITERPKTHEQIREEYEERTGDEIGESTLYRKLGNLQDRSLATKQHKGHGDDRFVFYAVPAWQIFYEQEIKMLRRRIKRNIFDKVKDKRESNEYTGRPGS